MADDRMTMAKTSRKPAGAPDQTRIVLIGRDAGNDLVLRQPSVSARHARVIVGPDGIWIEDLGSRNGTFVGTPPRRVERERITLDDPLVFGDAALPATTLRDFLERTQPRSADQGVIHLDDAALVTFGRRAGASVALDQPLVSALHASVAVDRGRVVVRDLGSTAGTFVDGRRIDRPVEIGPGTLVQVGDRRYRLSADARALQPIDTSADAVEAVQVAVEASGRRLLEGVSLVIQPGEMVAIMGPSGAGKSTLLSVLNGQVAPAAGRIVIGGLDLHEHFDLFRGRIGYVPQDDILHADLTVWQALWYAARLRLPRDMADEEIESRIRRVLSQLGLEGTEHTRVGDQRKRGVSGGQRKRVNLAMELLTDPPILVLDEPTSGLSSTDTMSVIDLLRSLADAGKTILVTIHQPSLQAYEKFDAVAVIARDTSTRQIGRLAWFGRAWPDAVNFFEPQPPGTPHPTTADGLLRGLATRPVADWVRQWEQSVAKSIWVDGRAGTHAARAGAAPRPAPRPVERLSQFFTLVKRGLAVKAADRWNTAVLFLQAPLVGLLIAAVFSKVLRSAPTGESWPHAGVSMATMMFVTALAAIWFGCSATAREIVAEWPIYRRERMVGLSILAYLGSKTAILLGIAAVQTALLLGIVAWACGVQSPWWHLALVLYAAGLAGGAVGLVVSATLRTTESATAILPVLLMPMIVLGGVLVPLSDLPKITQPLAAAMPSRWAFEGMVVPEAVVRPRLKLPNVPVPPRPATPAPSEPAGSAPPAAAASGSSRSRVPIVLTAGGRRRFILPGRQKIADALEDAAAKAEREMRQAKADAERKAADMQRQMQAEAERKAAEMRTQMEEKLRQSQAEFERQSAAMNATIESRIKEANKTVEDKLGEIQRGMEAERTKMNETLEQLGGLGQKTVVPAAAPLASGEVDMAERFFARDGWRAPPGLPLKVLVGMFVVGVVATGLALRRRDATGR
jgi:ABC-type multidrug transport system ATPase subunit/pSer/pThr/pTyr-binding forkhead associated (FHA) protein/Skp family chaperone for outer membrane proteins